MRGVTNALASASRLWAHQRPASRLPSISRSLHASSSVSKKSRGNANDASRYDEQELDEEPEYEADLFDSLSAESTPIGNDEATYADLASHIKSVYAISAPKERARAVLDTPRGSLRRLIRSCPEDKVEELRGILKMWRVAGGSVTTSAAVAIVGRLCSLGRPDLALELVEDRTQYGIRPLPTHSQTRLHYELLNSSQIETETETESPLPLPTSSIHPEQPFTPTLAVLRLALMQKKGLDASSEEIRRLAGVGGVMESKKDAKSSTRYREDGLRMLEAAGGVWAEAGRKLGAVA